MQEGAGARRDMDLLAIRRDIENIERLDRRFRLAKRVAKGREILVPHEMPRAFLHRVRIERRRDMPYPATLQRGRRAPVQDAVEITTAARRDRKSTRLNSSHE